MKSILKSLCAAALLVVSAFAFAAGTTGSTTIATLTPTNYGVIVFTVAGTITGAPGCASSVRFAVDTTSTATNSKALVVALLGAAAQQKTVVIIGTGTCTIDSTSENLHSLVLYP